MTVLLLCLAGPLQSWGNSSRFTRRETRSEPTKSGVLGMVAAAQGRRRSDPVEDLAQLTFGVRIDQPGELLRDFHTAHRFDSQSSMPLSYRYYLSDAVFVAGLSGEKNLLAGLDESIRNPTFPLYLGRRSCPPSRCVSMGLRDGELRQVLRDEPWQASFSYRKRQPSTLDLPIVIDAAAIPDYENYVNELVRDVPVSYSPLRREYIWRDVVRLPHEVAVDNPDGHTRTDFMATVMGA